MRQAQMGVDLLDAPLGAILVIDDTDRAVLYLDVVQHDVAPSGGESCACGDHAEWSGGVPVWPLAGIALLLQAAGLGLEPHGEHRPLQHHALGVDLAAEHLAEAHVKREPRHFQIGAGPVLRIDDLDIGEHDMRAWHEQERGRAVDRELAAGLLLYSCGDAIADSGGGDEQVEGDERDHEERDHPTANPEQQFHSHQAQSAKAAGPRYGNVMPGTRDPTSPSM